MIAYTYETSDGARAHTGLTLVEAGRLAMEHRCGRKGIDWFVAEAADGYDLVWRQPPLGTLIVLGSTRFVESPDEALAHLLESLARECKGGDLWGAVTTDAVYADHRAAHRHDLAIDLAAATDPAEREQIEADIARWEAVEIVGSMMD